MRAPVQPIGGRARWRHVDVQTVFADGQIAQHGEHLRAKASLSSTRPTSSRVSPCGRAALNGRDRADAHPSRIHTDVASDEPRDRLQASRGAVAERAGQPRRVGDARRVAAVMMPVAIEIGEHRRQRSQRRNGGIGRGCSSRATRMVSPARSSPPRGRSPRRSGRRRRRLPAPGCAPRRRRRGARDAVLAREQLAVSP